MNARYLWIGTICLVLAACGTGDQTRGENATGGPSGDVGIGGGSDGGGTNTPPPAWLQGEIDAYANEATAMFEAACACDPTEFGEDNFDDCFALTGDFQDEATQFDPCITDALASDQASTLQTMDCLSTAIGDARACYQSCSPDASCEFPIDQMEACNDMLTPTQLAALEACDDPGDPPDDPPDVGVDPIVDVTGDWAGSWNSDSGVSGDLFGSFSQSFSDVSGSVFASGSECFDEMSFFGTIDGAQMFGAADFADGAMRLDATIFDGSIEGSYFIDGGACSGDTGTFALFPNMP